MRESVRLECVIGVCARDGCLEYVMYTCVCVCELCVGSESCMCVC